MCTAFKSVAGTCNMSMAVIGSESHVSPSQPWSWRHYTGAEARFPADGRFDSEYHESESIRPERPADVGEFSPSILFILAMFLSESHRLTVSVQAPQNCLLILGV